MSRIFSVHHYLSLRILCKQLFMMDLLGRDTHQARILETNMNCYVTDRTRVISWSVKCFIVSIFMMMNLVMVYGCILYGFSKGTAWQSAWMFSGIAIIAIEILFNNVTEAIVIYYAIPETIFREAVEAKKTLSKIIRKFSKGEAFVAFEIKMLRSATGSCFHN